MQCQGCTAESQPPTPLVYETPVLMGGPNKFYSVPLRRASDWPQELDGTVYHQGRKHYLINSQTI